MGYSTSVGFRGQREEAASSLFDDDVRAAAAGNAKAYANLVDASRNVVCSIALATVRDVSVSEEIAQEVYLAAWRGLGTLRNPASFIPWIRQLTRNLSVEHLRRHRRREMRHLPRGEADEVLASVVDPAASAASHLVSSEDQRAVADAVDELPNDSREVVILFYREGRSAAQVAALLGLKESAVKKRLSRAQISLKETFVGRSGQAFARTTPSAAFTTVVVGMVVAGAPATATAAGLGVAKSMGSAPPLAKALATLGGAVLGLVSGLAGVWLGVQKSLQVARDEEERDALRTFRWANIALVVAVSIAWAIAPRVFDSPSSIMVTYAVFVVGMCASYGVWLPHIVARQHAAEVAEDPASARRHQRQRAWRWLGLLVGVTFGSLGVYFGLKARGAPP
jgi:RNA polymerase sigma factor (sigma-70 family)